LFSVGSDLFLRIDGGPVLFDMLPDILLAREERLGDEPQESARTFELVQFERTVFPQLFVAKSFEFVVGTKQQSRQRPGCLFLFLIRRTWLRFGLLGRFIVVVLYQVHRMFFGA